VFLFKGWKVRDRKKKGAILALLFCIFMTLERRNIMDSITFESYQNEDLRTINFILRIPISDIIFVEANHELVQSFASVNNRTDGFSVVEALKTLTKIVENIEARKHG
jgi:hypothetical protein